MPLASSFLVRLTIYNNIHYKSLSAPNSSSHGSYPLIPSLSIFWEHIYDSRRKSTFRRQKRKMSFLYQKIALTSFYPMVLVALQYPFVWLSYKRSRPRSYTAEERRNQAKKSRAMFPFTSVKRSGWSDHTHSIPGSSALRWEMS